MKRLLIVIKSLLLSLMWLGLCLPIETFAGDIYSYVDKNGARVFTDKKPKTERRDDIYSYMDRNGKRVYRNTPKPRAHVKIYPEYSVQNTKSGTTRIYKCVNSKGVHYASKPENSCYKLLYQDGNSIPKKTIPFDSSPPIPVHRKYRDYKTLVQDVATSTRLEPALLHAVIQTESAYNPKAISPKGAVGLMQLMPATARRFGVKDRTDATANVYGGARYLRHLLNLFNNNMKLALASYNAGENAVKRYGNKIPPYRETRNYVKKVMRLYKAYQGR